MQCDVQQMTRRTHHVAPCTLLPAVPLQASLPSGDALATQITIHAGKYAGGVVGKGSWTYE